MDLVCLALQLFLLAIFARIVLSWIPVSPGSGFASVASFIYRVTEPVLGPIRRAVPPVRFGAAAIDVSSLIVLLGIQLLMSSLC